MERFERLALTALTIGVSIWGVVMTAALSVS